MKKIFCYGDSNTYGFDPRSFWEDRYSEDSRWPDLLEARTGIPVINFGENGRCIPTHPYEYAVLEQQLQKAAPLSHILLFLGTNDLLQGKSPRAAAGDMESLILHLKNLLPDVKILLLSPPALRIPEPALQQSRQELTELYEALAGRLNLSFADTANLPLACDGVHLSKEGHRLLAGILALEITR